MIIYRGIFMDLEADPVTNAVEQVEKRVDIIKDENPFNVVITSETVGFDVLYTFTFDTLPAGAFQTQIMWSNDGGLTWTWSTGGISSPQTVLLPASVYVFQFIVYFPENVTVTYSQVETIHTLEMADDPLRDIVIDNDEGKFTPIWARQVEIKLHTSSNININTFASGSDTTYKVNVYRDDVLTFTGFLSTGELQQEFMPDPNVLILVAVDGLGFLNDIPLTNFDGDTPENEHPILHYLLWSLSKTGLRLNLAAIFNIREVTASTLLLDNDGLGHFFRHEHLDAKTFEDEVGSCINCYDVITRILGNEAYLCQYMGEWWIVRVDEMEAEVDQFVYAWDYEGTLVRNGVENHTANIGEGEAYSWMNDDALIGIEQLKKESRLTYRYVTPKETPCNIDLERGDPIDDSGDERTYELDCWTKHRENFPTSGLIAATTAIYIRRIFENDYEKERYVVIQAVDPSSNLIMSSEIDVQVKDKITVEMSRRLNADVGGSGFYRDNGMQVRLYGSDGTYWTLQGETSVGDELEWVESDADFLTNNNYLWFEGDVSRDMTEPESLYGNTTSPPMPVAGKIRLLAHQTHQASWDRDTYIDKVGFTLLAFINGSYRKYTAQQYIVAQATDNRNVREEEVFISDSPHPGFKGALKILVPASSPARYVLAGLFYNALQEQSGAVFPKRFGEIQAFDVWNQYNRTMVKFDGTIDHTNPHPSLITKYTLTDAHDNTAGRIFILLHYEADMHLCEWSAFLIESSNANIAKRYTGNTFKYLTNE